MTTQTHNDQIGTNASAAGATIKAAITATEQQLLPADAAMALKAVIKTTEGLIDISEREAQHLAKNDMLSFAILQDEKTILSERYIRLSQEFRSRLSDFRNTDIGLLDRLEKLQGQLSENVRINNRTIRQIEGKALKKTENTLLSAQEIGQTYAVEFPDTQDTQQISDNASQGNGA
jgi:hypothetical protein